MNRLTRVAALSMPCPFFIVHTCSCYVGYYQQGACMLLAHMLSAVAAQYISCNMLVRHAGIDDPYEEPANAELVLEAVDEQGNRITPQYSAGKILEYLHKQRII